MNRARLAAHQGTRAAMAAGAVAVAAAVAVLTTACSSPASSTGTHTASEVATTATGAGTSTPVGPGKLTGSAATALVTRAIANTQAAASVRVAGRATAKGTSSGAGARQPVSFDLTLVRNVGCEGTIALSKAQSFQIVQTGGYVWILPSSAFYTSLHLSKAALALVADKYIKVKSTDSQVSDLGKNCTFSGLLGSMSQPAGKDYTAVPVTYQGAPAYQVTQSGLPGTAFIANTATPLLLEITDPQATGGTITFTEYNATKTITPPTAAESIDGSQLGI